MNDIQNTKHSWKRIYTNTAAGSNERAKFSIWACEHCEAQFNHQYGLIPSIYEAMRREKVPEECLVKEPQ